MAKQKPPETPAEFRASLLDTLRKTRLYMDRQLPTAAALPPEHGYSDPKVVKALAQVFEAIDESARQLR